MDVLKLLIAVDESLASRKALQFIAPLAATGAVSVTVLARDGQAARATAVLDGAVALLGSDAVAERRVRPGRLEQVLRHTAAAEGTDVVVLTPPRQTVWRRWLRGRQALMLARRLPTSLLMVRGRHTVAPLRRALIAGAGGPSVAADAALAARMLVPVDGAATICHVVSQLPKGVPPWAGQDERIRALLAARSPATEHLQAAMRLLERSGVPAALHVRVGLVVDEVLAEVGAGDYQLLVIGAHQTGSRWEQFLLEDVSAELLLQSPVPVLVVRAGRGS